MPIELADPYVVRVMAGLLTPRQRRCVMNLDREQRDYLLDLLSHAHDEMLHELHHSDTAAFDEVLKQRIAVNERLQQRLRDDAAAAA